LNKTNIGKVIKLFISDNKTKKVIEQELLLLDIKGVNKDKFYNKDINRSVLLTSINSYEKLKDNNIEVEHGVLGENLLLSCNPHEFSIGLKIYIGDCVLEIAQKCTICNHLNSIDNKVPKLLEHDRGIFAKVISDGIINIDDSIFID